MCALLALNPKEYENTKYIFKDFTEVKAHANYPMCMRLTSDRQARWVIELLNDLIIKNGYELSELPKPIEVEPEIIEEELDNSLNIVKRDFRDFNQKLEDSSDRKSVV